MERLQKKALEFGVTLSDVQLSQFETYYKMLIEKNKVMNLTAITERNEVIDKHFVDTLALALVDSKLNNKRVLDLGTGAGFPGIPLKIAFPEMEIVLLDSLNKRIKFLDEVINALGFTGVTAIHGRAEDIAKDKQYRQGFDYVVSRAVANLTVLAEYCVPFVKIGGYFCPYKSGDVQEEITQSKDALGILGGKMEDTTAFTIPDTDMKRSILKIKKVKETPNKYPRKAGLPAKEPLHR